MPKKIIRLTEQQLHNIIVESIKEVLNESATSVVYHYCGPESLRLMLKTDSLYFSPNEKEYSDGYHYMSTTRMRNSRQGYAAMVLDSPDGGGTLHNPACPYCLIRIELDATAIQQLQYQYRKKHYNIKAKPFDWIYQSTAEDGGKLQNSRQEVTQDMLNNEFDDITNYGKIQPYAQAEERLYSKKSKIKGLHKCIRRIDVLFKNVYEAMEDASNLSLLMNTIDVVDEFSRYPEYENKFFCYWNNQDAFSLQSNKDTVNKDFINKVRMKLYDEYQRLKRFGYDER